MRRWCGPLHAHAAAPLPRPVRRLALRWIGGSWRVHRAAIAIFFAALPSGCGSSRPDQRIATAESLITAFYAFDSTALDTLLHTADSSRARILGYQAWAQGGNYSIEQRQPCEPEPAGTIRCAITVRDDIVRSLELSTWVTDTFRLTFQHDVLASVATSSNDPPVVDSGFRWVRETMPALYAPTGVCAPPGHPSRDRRACARESMAALRGFRGRTPR